MSTRIGLEMKLYRNTGNYSTPTWSEVTKAKDVTVTNEAAQADVSDRGSVWRKRRKGLRDLTFEFQLNYDPADSNVTGIEAAYTATVLANSTVDMAAADGAIATNGTKYWRAEMEIFTFTRSEPLEEAVVYDVTAMPTDSTNIPSLNTAP